MEHLYLELAYRSVQNSTVSCQSYAVQNALKVHSYLDLICMEVVQDHGALHSMAVNCCIMNSLLKPGKN